MSDSALRKQPDPTGDFDLEAASQRTDTDLWAAFHAAQGGESPQDAGPSPGAAKGSAVPTDEQLPPDDEPLDLTPLRRRFQGQQGAGEPRPTDPTSAFGVTPSASRGTAADGVTNHQLPSDGEPFDHRPLRVRFQEGRR
ncbi:hypothetical protein ACFY30_10015 [Streptomyces sp. NPDC000345]|uniref:hypothetical protein n=1 Tax=Streptomyces sp. NPDC000345 TaxID=3364537 RepID=UPI003688C175